MSEYLSWGDVAENAGNVLLNVVVALGLATSLVTAFSLFGRRYSLDPRVFPSVSANQRQWFGLLGFYLLLLTAMEILNPPTLEFLTSSSIAYRPSFLNTQYMGLTFQDLLSIAALAALLIVFVLRIRQLNRSTTRLPRQIRQESAKAARDSFHETSTILRFSFSFVAVSLLIAIIAPNLSQFGTESVGTIVILGLFLIGGVTSFLQGMQLGATYSAETRSFLVYQLFRHVFGPQWLLYIVVALAGYLVHSGLPGHFADDPNMTTTPELTRTVSKIVAGVLVVLAAYLVCWGVSGFADRLQRFIVVATLTPAVLPVLKLLAVVSGNGDAISTDPSSGFSRMYAVVLLLTPLVAYVFSATERSFLPGSRPLSIAYVRTLGWSPFVIGRSLIAEAPSQGLHYAPHGTAEELLDEMVGRKARGAPTTLPGSARLRHWLSKWLSWHRDYDAIVLDLRSAIRLFDALDQQGRLSGDHGYFIVAGICRTPEVIVQRRKDADEQSSTHAIWSDAPYISRNAALDANILETLRRFQPGLRDIDYLPPNCVLERLPGGAIAAIPEPFGSDLLSKTESRGDTTRVNLNADEETAWLLDNYDVLLMRRDSGGHFPLVFVDMLIAGRDWLRTKPGPTGIGGTFARQVAAELEGIAVAELEADPQAFLSQSAVNSCLVLTNFQTGSVIDPEDARSGSNWTLARDLCEHLRASGIVTSLTVERLAARVDCSHIQMNTDFYGRRASYPLQINRFLTNDSPGKLRDMLHSLQTEDVSLSFVMAQRVSGAGGLGLVYMLPKQAEDIRSLRSAADNQDWFATGTSGFVAVSVSDDPRGLVRMLDVVHTDPTLDIETLLAFPGAHGRAIVLMSFGDIADSQLRRLMTSLRQSGFDITTEPGQWSGG